LFQVVTFVHGGDGCSSRSASDMPRPLKATPYSRDPAYDWLVREIVDLFSFLETDRGFRRKIYASGIGCSISYSNDNVRVELGSERGERPGFALIVDGKRIYDGLIIRKRCPTQTVPTEPPYEGPESLKIYWHSVLEHLLMVVTEHADDLLDGAIGKSEWR